jgi:hypothetical protein
MTTIDPYRSQDGVANGQIFDPKVTVWENGTYADNYYQTRSSASGPAGMSIGADWEVDLSSYAGFDLATDLTLNTNLWGSHQRALTWYLSTNNVNGMGVSRFEVPSGGVWFDNMIFRRLGDLKTAGLDINSSDVAKKIWYTPDYLLTDASGNLQQLEHGSANATWEGVGTGWFHSVSGGGYRYRPVDQNSLVDRTKFPKTIHIPVRKPLIFNYGQIMLFQPCLTVTLMPLQQSSMTSGFQVGLAITVATVTSLGIDQNKTNWFLAGQKIIAIL